MTKRPTVAAVPSLPRPASSDAVLQTLAWIRKSGFKPVPLRSHSKAAVSRDYVTPDYRPPDDDAWKRTAYELGVVLGPKQGGPTDADLDCDEALFLAPRFLPATDAVFGRASKPRSHFLYRPDVSSLDKIAFIDPIDNSTIVEIRADGGHQTVMPGSIHEGTGELIEWSGVPFPEVPVVSTEALMLGCRKIAIATLIVRHAWFPGFHNEPTKMLSGLFCHLEWPVEEAESIISAVMELTDDTDRSRLPTVRATYKRAAAGRKVTGAGALRKQLQDDRIVDKILEWAGSPSINVINQYNERFAVVSVAGKFRIADTDVPPGEPPVFLQKDDFLGLLGTDYSDEVDGNGKPKLKARVWLAHPRRRQYRTVDFAPGAEDTPFLNLWTGFAVPPSDQLNPEKSCAGWLTLLHDVICGSDQLLCSWLLHWLANIIREPMHKSLTAPVIIGPEGAGKSLLLGYFGRILGPGYIPVTNEEHIHGRFNQHLSLGLLMHSEEALYAGDRKHAGIIRSLITDPWRIHEMKGVDARPIKNYLRLVLTSNETHAAPAKPGDRRYTVITMGDRKADDRLIRQVLAELDGDGPAALHRYLLDMKYDPKVPRINVKNAALIGMKAANFSAMEAWWYRALYEGQVLPGYLAWAADPAQVEWPHTVAGPALYASFCIQYRERSARGPVPSDTLLALKLNEFTGHLLVRERKRFNDPMIEDAPQMARHLGDRMSAITQLPDLAECRAAFERYMGQAIEWPDDSTEDEVDDDQQPKY